MARRNVNVIAPPVKDPAMIIFTNRMKKARKMADLAIRWNIGYYPSLTLTDEQWNKLAEAAWEAAGPGRPAERWESAGVITRKLMMRMLAVRYKVKLEGIWL